MAPSPTCLSCNRPFPRNGELASLPEGRRIAFDPGQRRVWRICTKCGEWNLLGAEAAGAALGELEARVPARGTALLITHVGPRLELLRVDNFRDVRVGELAMAERRDKLAASSRSLAALGVLMMGAFAWAAWSLIDSQEILIQLTLTFGIAILGREWYRRRLGLRVTTSRLNVGLLLLAGGLIAAISVGLPPSNLVSALTFGATILLTSNFLPLRLRLPSGRSVPASHEHWDAHGVRWDMNGGVLEFRAHDGRWLDAGDSRVFLRHLVDQALLPQATDEDLAKAHLLATTHSVAGILGALDAWRRDRDDTLRLTDIPVMYLVALDLGFARQEGGSLSAQLAHEKLLEAARVAEEAELFDKGTA